MHARALISIRGDICVFLLNPSELEILFWWSAEPGWRGNRLIVLCEELVIMFIAGGGEAEQLSNRLLSTMSASGFIQFSRSLLLPCF